MYQRWIKGAGYFGNYRNWDEAKRASTGYDADLILQRVRSALLKVKSGEAVYERDSVLFDEIQYAWPLLAGLIWIASQNDNRLDLIDFGGSLGSSYFQNRKFLGHLGELSWNIVEQENFVLEGRRNFEDENLKFYSSIDECLQTHCPTIILLSSVLPYIEKPYSLLGEILERDFGYIVIDRTLFWEEKEDRVTIQKVPSDIYQASYPAWIFNEHKFFEFFASGYEVIASFASLAGEICIGGDRAVEKGFILRKRCVSFSDIL